MAPKRKKKIEQNPARGFATVSVPSKPKSVTVSNDQQVTGDSEPTSRPGQGDKSESLPLHNAVSQTSAHYAAKTIESMSSEEFEAYLADAELQNLVDLHARGIKSEAFRQATSLRNERRQLRAQSHRLPLANWFSEELVQRILCLDTRISDSSGSQTAKAVKLDNSSVLLRAWALQEVLRLLDLRDTNKAIEHVLTLSQKSSLEPSSENVSGLSEALEWYGRTYEPTELPDYETGSIARSEEITISEPLGEPRK